MYSRHRLGRTAAHHDADADLHRPAVDTFATLLIIMMLGYGYGLGMDFDVARDAAESTLDAETALVVHIDASGTHGGVDGAEDLSRPVAELAAALPAHLAAAGAGRVDIVLRRDLPASSLLRVVETLRTGASAAGTHVAFTVTVLPTDEP